VTDELWDRIQPLLPIRPRRFRYPGRKPLDDRQVLNGILFVLVTGISWEHLPRELGYGSGMTAGVGCGTGTRPGSGIGSIRSCSASSASGGGVRNPVQIDRRGSGFMVRLCDGADSFGLIIWLSAGCVPSQRRRAVTIQARELNQTPSSLRCAASASRRRPAARAAAAESSRFSTSLVQAKPRTQLRAAATSGP
jgi:hypothetical protein